jgi:hypothetical protein
MVRIENLMPGFMMMKAVDGVATVYGNAVLNSKPYSRKPVGTTTHLTIHHFYCIILAEQKQEGKKWRTLKGSTLISEAC